jgi:hypothetical protein
VPPLPFNFFLNFFFVSSLSYSVLEVAQIREKKEETQEKQKPKVSVNILHHTLFCLHTLKGLVFYELVGCRGAQATCREVSAEEVHLLYSTTKPKNSGS